MATKIIKAILLDVGGPIVDDSALDDYWNDYLLKNLPEAIGREITLQEIEETNRSMVECFCPSVYSGTLWHYLRPDKKLFKKFRAEFDKLDFPQFYKIHPGVEEILRSLRRNYILAIAANQGSVTGRFLEQAGILQHFTFKEMSSDMPYSKPDQRFFEYISNWVKIPMEECLMVGDRIDNDIVPAKRMGLSAIKYAIGLHKDQKARIPSEEPDAIISSLDQLEAAINHLQNIKD